MQVLCHSVYPRRNAETSFYFSITSKVWGRMNLGMLMRQETRILLALVRRRPLGHLSRVQVVLLGELHVTKELGVHTLHPGIRR